jgi:2-polyprenyl-3-methyl-5-hydroxy-6-metoxy-1,4-benzoquinol methylase
MRQVDTQAVSQVRETTQTCPICENQKPRVVWEKEGLKYLSCTLCGLAFLSPLKRGSLTEVGEAQSSLTAPDYLEKIAREATIRGQLARFIAAQRLSAYQTLLGTRPASILEIGAGDGAFSSAYTELGIDYLGVDVNPFIVKEAQKLGRNIMYGSSQTAANLKRTFDVVFFSQVLEHILDPKSFLQEVSSLLTPEGIVHIEVPNHDGLFARLRKVKPRNNEYGFLQPPHHQIAYTKKAMNYLLRTTSYEPLWVKQISDFDPVWGEVQVSYSTFTKVSLQTAAFLGMGSLLVAVARKRTYRQ